MSWGWGDVKQKRQVALTVLAGQGRRVEQRGNVSHREAWTCQATPAPRDTECPRRASSR